MANHYVEFSEELEDLTPAEAQWCRDRLTELTDCLRPFETPSPAVIAAHVLGAYNIEALDFLWHVDDTDPRHVKLWLHANEYGDVMNVAAFVQEFLTKWRPEG